MVYPAAAPPTLNWIYVDGSSLELKYGTRSQSLEHIVGPWDWTDDDESDDDGGTESSGVGDGGSGVLLEGKEAFVAVEMGDGLWQVVYDKDTQVRGGRWRDGRRALEISLERRVLRDESHIED